LTARHNPWSSGETAYISVCLALYLIGWVVSFLGLIRLVVDRALYFLIIIMVLVCSLFTFRSVLFIMALANADGIARTPAIGYVLIEFPLILFFSFVSIFILTWVRIVRATKNLDYGHDRWLPVAFFLTGFAILFVLGVFVLMVILYSTVVNAPTFVCQGTFLLLDTSASFAIIMTYRSIFSALELLLGIVLLKIGTQLVLIFHKFRTKIQVPMGKQIKIGLAVYSGSFGLFAQAIYYLVITASKNPYQSIYLSLSILLVDEIIPALCFFVVFDYSSFHCTTCVS